MMSLIYCKALHSLITLTSDNSSYSSSLPICEDWLAVADALLFCFTEGSPVLLNIETNNLVVEGVYCCVYSWIRHKNNLKLQIF